MNPYKMYLSTEHIHEPSNMPAATTATTIGGDPHKFGFCINIGILAGWYCCYQRSFFISCKGKVPVCVCGGFYSNKAVNKFFLLNLNELKCKTFYSVHFDKSWNIPLPDVQILQIYFSEQRIYSFDKLLYKRRKKKINISRQQIQKHHQKSNQTESPTMTTMTTTAAGLESIFIEINFHRTARCIRTHSQTHSLCL